jgi:tellurite resistance protein TerC
VDWTVFGLIIIAMLGLDLFVFHGKNERRGLGEAALWSLLWISLALLFCLYLYFTQGKENATLFLTGYLIEKLLSIDNLFVFFVIFEYFQTPPALHHKVLYWGVLGAILMRALLIAAGLSLVKTFHVLIYVFGAFLIFTGIKFGLSSGKKLNLDNNFALKLFKKHFSIASTYEKDHFFIKTSTGYKMTPLFVVLLSIETADLIFAIDSIPAILTITLDPFLVYSSNIFAILGLRALFFMLSGVMRIFYYLHYGLALILVLIGLKMILSEWIKIPVNIVLATIFLILAVSVLISLIFAPPNENDKISKS